MRAMWFLGALAATLVVAREATADPLYSVSDLGTGVTFQSDTSGMVSTLTGQNGAVYAFDKSPVTSINERQYDSMREWYTQNTMQIGNFKVGYRMEYLEGQPIYYASFAPDWSDWTTPSFSGQRIVSDINVKGQVVGTGYLNYYTQPSIDPKFVPFAAFTDVGMKLHGKDASVADNLNNYITPIPNVTLTAATNIDDLGRIVADGSDGHVYLLTPTALGSAVPVPEPSSAVVFAVVGSALGLHALRRRK